MSRKHRHQKQVNNDTLPIRTEEGRPVEASAPQKSFDAMLSSAIQRMLDETPKPKATDGEDAPVLELPERKHKPEDDRKRSGHHHSSDRFVSTDRVPADEASHTSVEEVFHNAEPADEPQSEQDVPKEEKLLTDFLRTYSDSPLNSMDYRQNGTEWQVPAYREDQAPQTPPPDFAIPDEQEDDSDSDGLSDEELFAAFDRPREPIDLPDEAEEAPYGEYEEDVPYESVEAEDDFFDRFYAAEKEAGAPAEDTVPAETAAPLFTVPAVADDEDVPAPTFFAVPQPREEAEAVTAPVTFTVPELPPEDSSENAPEVFTVPHMNDAADYLDTPTVFAVPETAAESEPLEAPEVFTVPDKPQEDCLPEEPEKFLPQTEEQPKPEKKHFHLFHSKKSADTDRKHKHSAPEPMPETADNTTAEEPCPLPPAELPEETTEDTTSLLSVIQGILGEEAPAEPEIAPEELPQPEAIPEDIPRFEENRKKIPEDIPQFEETPEAIREAQPQTVPAPLREAPQLTGDTIRFAPISAAADDVSDDTVRFTPLHGTDSARQEDLSQTQRFAAITEPPAVPAERPRDFWDEFDELKNLVGDTPAFEDEPTEAQAPETAAPTEPTDLPESAEAGTALSSPTETTAPQKKEKKGLFRKKTAQKPAPQETPPTEANAEADMPEADTVGAAASDTFGADTGVVLSEINDILTQPEETAQAPTVIQSAAAIPVPELPTALPPAAEMPAAAVPPAAMPAADQSAPVRPSAKKHTAAPPPAPVRPQRKKTPARSADSRSAEERLDDAQKTYKKQRSALSPRLAGTVFVTIAALLLTLLASGVFAFVPQFIPVKIAAYILLGLMLLSGLLAADIYREALQKLRGMQFTAPILIAVAALAVTVDTFLAASAGRLPFCAAICVFNLFLLWNRYDGIAGLLTTLQVLRNAKEPTGISEVPDVMLGQIGLSRADGSVSDFLDHYEQTPPTGMLMQIYVPAAVLIGLILSAVIAAKYSCEFFWTASLMLLGSVPLIGIMNFNRLFCILSKRLSDSDAALCGWYGAETFGGDHCILINDSDLFPPKNIKLNGIKLLTKDADRVIGYTAATTKAVGILLHYAFEEELRSRNARQYRVDRFRIYESGGIGAEICGDIVLVGTLEFMRRMGVHMEGGMKLRQAVYTSVNGELAAVFAIKYTPRESVRKGLAAIAENRHFRTVFATRDFLMTQEMIAEKYEITLNNSSYPPAKERIRLSEAEMKEKGKQGAIMADDSFGSFADAAAGGRVLKSAVGAASLLTVLNGLLGFVLMAVLTSHHGIETATAVNVLLYQLIWAIPTLLLTGWTRRY